MLSVYFSPLFLSLFAQKETSSCGFSVPCLSLWVCHSTRERIRMSLDTVWPGTDFAGVLKHTAYRVGWNLSVWLVWSFLQKCSFFCQFTEVISESVQTFCQIIVFCQMLCFNCRCLIVSKKNKDKDWNNLDNNLNSVVACCHEISIVPFWVIHLFALFQSAIIRLIPLPCLFSKCVATTRS